jgi:hypothetical protein
MGMGEICGSTVHQMCILVLESVNTGRIPDELKWIQPHSAEGAKRITSSNQRFLDWVNPYPPATLLG